MSTAELPVRAVTRGPRFHWFGYYDKLQFDPSGRFLLGMEVGFEHRSPLPDDAIKVGLIDLEDGDRWTELGETRAWCWQQGCMLQWRPGSDSEVVWNDRDGDRFVCRVLDVRTGDRRTLPGPVYTLTPDGRTGFAPDFARVNEMRPGYGYCGLPDLHADEIAPGAAGIWRMDLESGVAELIVPLAEVAGLPWRQGDFTGAKHYFNHLLVNPDGTRLEFLHRWGTEGGNRWATRMLTVAPDGSDLRVVDDNGMTSHFIWRDTHHILAWSRAASERGDFCLFDERSGECEAVGSDAMTQDGHVNCLPGSRWLINDSYPGGDRRRVLYLYDVDEGVKVPLGSFLSPVQYDGEWRCDLHPRLSRDARLATIDSVHEGHGRQIYLVDVGSVVAPCGRPAAAGMNTSVDGRTVRREGEPCE